MYKSIKNPLKLSPKLIKKKLDLLLIFLLILASFLTLLSFFDFNKSIYRSVISESKQYTEQLSAYVIQIFQTQVEQCFTALDNTETFLDSYDTDELFSSSTLQKLKRIQKEYDFSLLGIVDKDGNTKTTVSNSSPIKNTALLEEVFAGNRYISDVIQTDSTKETMILIAVPIQKKNTITGALYAYYKVSNIVDRFDSLPSDINYFQIIDSEGTYITKSTSSNTLAPLPKIYKYL